jgi:hypothetical protein
MLFFYKIMGIINAMKLQFRFIKFHYSTSILLANFLLVCI